MSDLIIQANLQHAKAATSCLIHDVLVTKGQVVALVQEPHLGGRGYPVGIPKTLGCHYFATKGECRAAIFTKNCNLLLCPEYSWGDIVVCQLHMNGGREGYVVSVYCDININCVPLQLEKLLGDKKGCDILISMDANAHSPMWGSMDSNSRGNMVEEFIFLHDLQVCSKGSSPTFVGRGTGTAIDITLCTRNLYDYIGRWKGDLRDHLSDHRWINFWLDLETPASSRSWAFKKADWGNFSTLMGVRSSNFRPHRFWTADTLDREVRLLYNDLKSCISKVCPKIRVRHKQANPWWSDDLSKQKRAVRQLQQQVIKHRADFPLWVQYKKARNDFCSAIRKAKKQTWRSFAEDASNTDGMLRVARATLQHRTPQVGHLKKRDGNYTQSREEVLDTLMDSSSRTHSNMRRPKLPPLFM